VRRVALVLLMSACGRVAFDDADALADASPDSVPPGFCATAQFANPPASSLKDDFTTPYTTRWAPINPQAPCINQVGAELVAAPDPAGMFCYADTISAFHLTCDSIFLKVPEVTSPVLRVQTLLYVYSVPDDLTFNVLLEAGGLQMAVLGNTTTRVDAPFDPALDVWWRLSEFDGVTTFDTSPDGVTWRELMRMPTPLLFDHVIVSIGAGVYQPVASPGQARFRCYNVPPPCN
jgi:hypothetical protein